MSFFYALLYIFGGAVLCRLFMPAMQGFSHVLCLVDAPVNKRKVHHNPVPAVGGLVIACSVFLMFFLSGYAGQFLAQYPGWAFSVLLLLLVSVLDDRLNLPASLRFGVQLFCAFLVAREGFRITSLYGILGIETLPLPMQYLLTIVVITAITNAFNLIDGIDGLAGSLLFINLLVIALLLYIGGQTLWLYLVLPVLGALPVFLRYNWNPAKVFLGDGGSVVLGFIAITLSLYLANVFANDVYSISAKFMLTLTASLVMIPATDMLRVFLHRLKKGVSPFRADKNHLHHWFLKHRVKHAHATTRLVFLQLFLLLFTLSASFYLNEITVLLFQFVTVAAYTLLLQLHTHFTRWYLLIRRMEYRTRYQYH